ncbi:hypothetical protein BJ742DRAFT_779888 [Cladochytrium replicatum]|nr:hypothetical protein BJ742DRAFT_779888 [Cladochytrium replicatum]
MAQNDQRKPEMVHIVSIRSFTPKPQSTGSVSVVKGQEYFLMGVNLEYNIFFVTNDKKLPFSKRAVAGYAPAAVFAFVEPVGSDVDRKKGAGPSIIPKKSTVSPFHRKEKDANAGHEPYRDEGRKISLLRTSLAIDEH